MTTMTAPAPLTEATDTHCLPETWARRLLSPTPWRRFAVLGDSLAEGIGDSSPGYRDVVWSDRVAEAFATSRSGFAHLNTGTMFETIGQVTRNQLPRIVEFRPDLAYIICGANDLFMPDPDLAVIESELDALFGAVRATGAQLCTQTLTDSFGGRRKMAALREMFVGLNDVIRRTAARHDAIVVELWDHPAALRADWLSADRLHPTRASQAIIAAEVTVTLSRHTVA